MRWLILSVSLLLVAALHQSPPPLLAPSDAFLLAYRDAVRLPPEIAAYTRYLWLPNLPPERLPEWHAVLAGHVNQLSRKSVITPPRVVPGSHGQLLAVNLHDYGWAVDVWDRFQTTDPTFNAIVVVQTVEEYEEEYQEYFPGGVAKDGKHYQAGTYTYKRKKTRPAQEKKVQAFAPWLVKNDAQKEAVDRLPVLTASKAPVVNAMIFLDNSGCAGDGRSPDYFDFLGIKDEATFQKLCGVNLKESFEFSGSLMAAVGLSGVTQSPRGIQRFDSIGGAYWRSLDVNHGAEKDDTKNALRAFSTDAHGNPVLRFDASEVYGTLPNRLFAYGLFNAKGVKQDRAPDTIAADAVPILRNNHSVKICVSCVRCHTTGLQDIDDWWRNFPPELNPLLGDRQGKKALDYDDVVKVRQEYARKLEPFLKQDRERYAAALQEACGMKPEQFSTAFPKAWQYAADANVDLEYMSRDTGVPVERLAAAITHQVKLGRADPVLAQFVLPAARRKTISITTWRASYGLAQQYAVELPP